MQASGNEKSGIAEVRALAECIGGVTLGILAGGKSTRMGRDKACLVWHGRTLAEHIAERFGCCAHVLVSAADAEQLAGFPYPVVTDGRAGYGPLEGLYRLLLSAKTEWVFAVATDLPLVNCKLLACLIDQLVQGGQQKESAKAAAVIPCADDRVHPLCGLYHKRALPQIEALFAREEHRVRALLDELETIYVPVDVCGVDARVLMNVNTPEEYDRLLDMEEHYESCDHYIE